MRPGHIIYSDHHREFSSSVRFVQEYGMEINRQIRQGQGSTNKIVHLCKPVKSSLLLSFIADELKLSKLLRAGDSGMGQSGNMSGTLLLSNSDNRFSKLTEHNKQTLLYGLRFYSLIMVLQLILLK